jgi:hypothetical protein
MWSWFGGSAAKRDQAPKEAILQLREQLEMLDKRGRYLESQIEEQQDVAKKSVAKNKESELDDAWSRALAWPDKLLLTQPVHRG